MCKNLNIGIVLFLIIGLVMSGCIRKLNLYQGDKDEDENKDNGKRRDVICETDRKSTRLNSSHYQQSRMPSSA